MEQREMESLAVFLSCCTYVDHPPWDFLQCEAESPGMRAAVGLVSYLQLVAFPVIQDLIRVTWAG